MRSFAIGCACGIVGIVAFVAAIAVLNVRLGGSESFEIGDYP